jgi:cellobiose-specific phosphotransferase system component IIC
MLWVVRVYTVLYYKSFKSLKNSKTHANCLRESVVKTMSNTLVNSICQCISNALNSECEDQIRQRRRKASTVNQNKNAPNVSEKPFDIATICFSVDLWLLLLETICVDVTGSSILRISFCSVMLSSVLTVSFSNSFSGLYTSNMCVCNGTVSDQNQIRCNWCQSWFHERRVGIGKDDPVGFWSCTLLSFLLSGSLYMSQCLYHWS